MSDHIELTQRIVDAARRHEPSAVESVYRALSPAVYGYVLNQTRNRSWADDVTGDVFVEAIRSLDRFEGTPEGLKAWVFRIARNTLIDHIRRESRRTHDPVDDASHVLDPHADPESDALASVERDRIRRFVDDLPPDQREVVLLRLVGDLPIAEVAELTGRTAGAVKALQHRALQGLARRMERSAAVSRDDHSE